MPENLDAKVEETRRHYGESGHLSLVLGFATYALCSSGRFAWLDLSASVFNL